jgi:phosphate transport system substrate-binding protein
VEVDYQSVGSGSGVKSVIDHTVDFGASDAAMKPDEMARVQLFPMTAGSIVIAYNLKGVNLKLSRKAYSGIFLGKVKRWNAPEIVASNPGVSLPDLAGVFPHAPHSRKPVLSGDESCGYDGNHLD